jgi:hypothetical protein
MIYTRKDVEEICKRGHSLHYVCKLWYATTNRCHNQRYSKYKDYGGRGIVVYDEWRFSRCAMVLWVLNNLGPRPTKGYSLDRINCNGNYEPGNLRWATHLEQMRNRRYSRKSPRDLKESYQIVTKCTSNLELKIIRHLVDSQPMTETEVELMKYLSETK